MPDVRLIALGFDSPLRAQEALLAAMRLQEERQLVLHDAVLIARSGEGPPEVTETMDPTAVAAAVPSALFGALAGTLLAGPLGFLIGGAVAGGGGALAAKLIDTGIPYRTLTELQERTRPGQTVVALLVSDIAGIAVIDELRRFQGAEVVYAELPPGALELVRQVLARAS